MIMTPTFREWNTKTDIPANTTTNTRVSKGNTTKGVPEDTHYDNGSKNARGKIWNTRLGF